MESALAIRQSLIGTWSLGEYVAIRKDNGENFHPLGLGLQGSLLYTADDSVSVHFMQPGMAEHVDTNPANATLNAQNGSMRHYLAYCGTFHVDEGVNQSQITHQIALCNIPDWVGQSQRRIARLSGNQLELSTPEPVLLDVSHILCSYLIPQTH
ncbi:hypothetical protein N7450_010950 [Penicillium hetheringtonii]|uniref:Lipocalin-like domain-containing protein n=1 Tax=Penicillium hetheringtonii TaxID=911720 RepID=A0AAD6D907_9EURO|nr:hypothetical protein N7450_010950 [Penicillium hetheringtonii]